MPVQRKAHGDLNANVREDDNMIISNGLNVLTCKNFNVFAISYIKDPRNIYAFAINLVSETGFVTELSTYGVPSSLHRHIRFREDINLEFEFDTNTLYPHTKLRSIWNEFFDNGLWQQNYNFNLNEDEFIKTCLKVYENNFCMGGTEYAEAIS